MGCRKLPDAKTLKMTIAVSPFERAGYKALAKDKGKSVSQIIREGMALPLFPYKSQGQRLLPLPPLPQNPKIEIFINRDVAASLENALLAAHACEESLKTAQEPTIGGNTDPAGREG
jgi:hypothetical protein